MTERIREFLRNRREEGPCLVVDLDVEERTDILTFSQRLADQVTGFCGSWSCVIAFTAVIVLWIILNSLLLWFGIFDPYPYIFLNLVLTVVGTLQGPLIMMSQNRQADRDREDIKGLHEKLDQILETAAPRSDVASR